MSSTAFGLRHHHPTAHLVVDLGFDAAAFVSLHLASEVPSLSDCTQHCIRAFTSVAVNGSATAEHTRSAGRSPCKKKWCGQRPCIER